MFPPGRRSINKVTFVGEPIVGKTTILTRFLSNVFMEQHYQTVGIDVYNHKSLLKDGTTIDLAFHDTSGQEFYSGLTESYIRGSRAVVLVFDLSRQITFKNLIMKTFTSYVATNTNKKETVYVLVGNKSDLIDPDSDENIKCRQLYVKFAEQIGAKYHEISAKTFKGVQELMSDLSESVSAKNRKIAERINRKKAQAAQDTNGTENGEKDQEVVVPEVEVQIVNVTQQPADKRKTRKKKCAVL